jgi:hypothetical protein
MTSEKQIPEKQIPTKNVDELMPPDEFYKIINDFTTDIKLTFPEYSHLINKWWTPINEENPEIVQKETLYVFRHCLKVFPERFFDILYKTVDIFSIDSEVNTEFLPGIVFKHLWSYDITDNTRTTIWNYLQLISFAVIGSVRNVGELGDTAKLFESINEDELKTKLQETLANMQNLFDRPLDDTDSSSSSPNTFSGMNLPNAGEIHEHISSMMGGKLGKLAMELAEETAGNLNLDMENVGDAKDVFQKLFNNPTKMMDMVKNIGSKIDTKIKSGEIKESELMEEGMDLLNKMKNMPGMGDMSKMFAQMGIPGLGKGAKINVGAMEAQLDRNMKSSKLKERLRAKAEGNAVAKALEKMITPMVDIMSIEDQLKADEELFKIFSTGEKVDRTPRGTKPPEVSSSHKKKNKK